MALTSFSFFIFAAVVVILYFVFPKGKQWWVLLAGSLFFYLMTGWNNIFYILITAVSSYAAARIIENISGRKDLEKSIRKRRKLMILIATLVLNFGLLCTFKYLNFFIEQINSIICLLKGIDLSAATALAQTAGLGGAATSAAADPAVLTSLTSQAGLLNPVILIIPLGISFYTFQTMGYLIDVYWGKISAQRNFCRLLLFVSFFPQITQGPISEYRQLNSQLFEPHKFSYDRFAWGIQRFLWGFLKKAVCADVASHCVRVIFTQYDLYCGVTVLIGAFIYSIQIYADFSGYMDMMCGLCEIMGIELAENFDRPYFSRSIAEYWRRWHITLGNWFKTYIYYPIAMSKRSRKLAKAVKNKAGKRVGDAVPATIALIVTWFVTGLWHGATWGYIVWGLLNGFFLILQVWLDPFYALCRRKLHIKEEAWWWKIFTILRTFVLITFIKVLPEVGTLKDGLKLWRTIFLNHVWPDRFEAWFPYNGDMINLTFMAAMIILIFIADLLRCKKPVREYFNKMPMVVRILLLALAFVVAVGFGIRTDSGDFMYANF